MPHILSSCNLAGRFVDGAREVNGVKPGKAGSGNGLADLPCSISSHRASIWVVGHRFMVSASHCYFMYCVWTATQSGSYPESFCPRLSTRLCFCAVVCRDWHSVLQDLERDMRVFYLTNVPLVCPVSQRATAGTYSGFEGAHVTRLRYPHRVDFCETCCH